MINPSQIVHEARGDEPVSPFGAITENAGGTIRWRTGGPMLGLCDRTMRVTLAGGAADYARGEWVGLTEPAVWAGCYHRCSTSPASIYLQKLGSTNVSCFVRHSAANGVFLTIGAGQYIPAAADKLFIVADQVVFVDVYWYPHDGTYILRGTEYGQRPRVLVSGVSPNTDPGEPVTEHLAGVTFNTAIALTLDMAGIYCASAPRDHLRPLRGKHAISLPNSSLVWRPADRRVQQTGLMLRDQRG